MAGELLTRGTAQPGDVIVADDQTSARQGSPRTGLRQTARAFLDLVEPGERFVWGLLLGLALFAAIVEMLGAILVIAIAGMFAADVDPSALPVVGGIIEQLGGGDPDREILIVAAFATVFYTFRGAVVLGETYYQARVTQENGRRISIRLFRGYLSMPYPFFLQRNTAELIRTAFNSVRIVVTDFLLPILKLISFPVKLDSPSILMMARPPEVVADPTCAPSIQTVTSVPSAAGLPSTLTTSFERWGGTG
ncbi:MAG: hypothetical protein IIA44_14140 [Acidobacteria bacterium]|nr:hypothetical protein [Acidobacteriota bacterium]